MREMAADKPETKNKTVIYIKSSHSKIFEIDVAYISDFISRKHRYLVTMIDHFSKYGRTKQVKKNFMYNSFIYKQILIIMNFQKIWNQKVVKN